MAELEIKGKKAYIKYLSEHLKDEHPSTRRRMEVELEPERKKKSKKHLKSKYSTLKGTIFTGEF